MRVVVLLLLACLLTFVQCAQADDQSLRIARPSSAAFAFHEIFTTKRVPDGEMFARWRRDYCCPSVCAMVLCHGGCADTATHCPSFAESSNVLNRLPTCASADTCRASADASQKTVPQEHDCCLKK